MGKYGKLALLAFAGAVFSIHGSATSKTAAVTGGALAAV